MQTKMLYTHGTCPYCNAKIFPYSAEEWLYGSPIKTCKKCSKNYIDNRYHEIAVEGAAPNTLSVKRNVIGIIVMLIDLIRIITGTKAKKLEKLRIESVKRLQDKNYAQELFLIGYCVPEEYLSDSDY